MKNIRAGLRAVIAFGLMLPGYIALSLLQGFVVGPLLKNHTAIPNMMYGGLRRLLGYKIEFNKASAPIVKGRPAWYVANHLSNADFVLMGCKFDGTFAGKGDVLKWPVVAQMAAALKYIGLRRDSKHNAESRGKIIRNFNRGLSTIMFPEGTTTDGSRVALFRAALPSLLYGEKGVDKNNNEIALTADVAVQPVAIVVKSIDGQDARADKSLVDLYSMQNDHNALKRIWKRFTIRRTVVELTVFDPLNPRDFADAKELMNHAAQKIANIVNPGQTTFEKARIPGK